MDSSFSLKSFISLFVLICLFCLVFTKPALALEEGDCFNTSTVVITGSITDASGISEIIVTVDGSTPSAFDIDNGNWTATFTGLSNGPHTLMVTGTDACGSGNTATTDPLGFEVDTAATVTITFPVDGQTVTQDNITVTGTADTDITSVTVTTDQEHNESSPVVSGGWTVTLTGVSTPSIVITAKGTDDCGNTGSDSVTVPVVAPVPCSWFVNDDATGAETGLSWADAFTVVQDAVNASTSGEIICVAEGTYTNSPTSTASVLTMKAGVEIYGGFIETESSPYQRGNPAIHPTVLDGEDTSYHVVAGASNARLDGFIVKDGNAGVTLYGGGMYNAFITNLTVENCSFTGNFTPQTGGGMYNYSSSPEITNCTFSDNTANLLGGGIYNLYFSSPTITNCSFIGNSSNNGGGILNNDNSSPEIVHCSFSGNTAFSFGGAIFNISNSSPTITNCIFFGNSATSGGGAMNNNSSTPTITNCTFSGNLTGGTGGGMYNLFSTTVITNCIMWGDIPNEIYNSGPLPTVTYSDIMGGGYPGIGNIVDDPQFVSGDNGDYYLSQIAAGQGINSPCVDAGSDTAENLGLDDRATRTDGVPDSGIVDMGYHYWPSDITPPGDLAASPPGGIYCPPGVTVTLSCDDPSATIYYTTDGSGPTTASPVYSGPIVISIDTTLKFMALDISGNQTITVTEVYDIDTTAPGSLAATPAGGSYCPTLVTLSCNDLEATIYYTTDGSGPTTGSPVYAGPIDISVDTTLKFMAVDVCGNQSGTVTDVYTIDTTAPGSLAASPAGGSHCPTLVTLSCNDLGATIYYTTDGSGPTTASPVYAGPIDISVDTTLKFMAVDTCGYQSGTVTEVYDIYTDVPTGLEASPAGGSYCATTVTLSAIGAATIYYTLDGSGPTTMSPVYIAPIDISTDTTLKFMAVEDTCGNQSGTVTEVYDIDDENPTVTIISPTDGIYLDNTTVVISGIADDGTGSGISVVSVNGYTASGTDSWSITLTSNQYGEPVEVSFRDIADWAYGVFVSEEFVLGDYAYVADWSNGLAIIDVSEPANPGTPIYRDTSGNSAGVYVTGGYAYVANGSSGLAIIAVSEPANPGTPVYRDTGGNNWGVYVTGGYAYVGARDSGLAIIDVSDPANPGTPIYRDTTGSSYEVYVTGGYAYVADSGSGLAIIDVSDPTNPGPPVYRNTSGNSIGIYVTGGYAYVADYSSGLAIIDVSDPSNPGTPVYQDTSGSSYRVQVTGGYAYVADGSSGLAIIDVSDPANPGTPIYHDTPGSSRGVYVIGGYAYVADYYDLRIIDISSFNYPVFTAVATDNCGNTGSDSVAVTVANSPPCDWFVNDNAMGVETGLSWTDAFTNVQEAMDMATSVEVICVAEGTYINSPTSTVPVLTMKAGVEIYGGFTGTESKLFERGDPADHPTVLDGEETSYHVVAGASYARLDGFIVTNGFAVGVGYDSGGGGMFNYGASDITVANCTFSHNSAMDGGGMFNRSSSPDIINCIFNLNLSDYGGGIHNFLSSSNITNCTFINNSGFQEGGGVYSVNAGATITSCTFRDNFSDNGGGVYNGFNSLATVTNCIFSGNEADNGGGMYNYNNGIGSHTVTNCTFGGNEANNNGGGMYNDGNSIQTTITNCTFNDNSSLMWYGGGIHNSSSSPEITNCIFSYNSAPFGGGISNYFSSSPTILNCSFSDNSANVGGGMFNTSNCSPEITDCIFWNDVASSGPEIALYSTASPSTLTISYSDVQGGPTTGVYVDPDCTLIWGAGMIGELPEDDPLFVSGTSGDYYLSQTAAGQGVDSPCVDAGSDTAVNLGMDDKTTRTDDVTDADVVDMGYHYEP